MSYLSVRFSAMVLGSSLTGLWGTGLLGFSSFRPNVLTPHFPLPEEPSRALELLLRLEATVDDFRRYSRDW